MRKLFLGGLLVLVAAALVVTVATAKNGDRNKTLQGELDGFQENPPVSTTGEGDIKVKLRSDSIEFRLRYQDLEAPVKFAHIHFGQEGVNGGVAAFLCGGGGKPDCPDSGTVTGTIVAADIVGPKAQGIDPAEPTRFAELVRAIKHGVTYANVHTDKFGDGEIRGQIEGHDDDDDGGDDD